FMIPETHDPKTLRGQPRRTLAVGNSMVGMLTTIQLDNELRFVTSKINDITPQNDLPAKLETQQVLGAQAIPELLLGISLFPAQNARQRSDFLHHPLPNPSPLKGEGLKTEY